LTFDPDLFGWAKFRQNKAIDEFLIFEIPDLASYINDWGPLCPFILYNNYIKPLLTPRGLLTFDPDLFGLARFRQNKAIDEFLIFEIPDLADI
jgi:hypothetical protein